ncbi:MAG: amidohydrolase family protein [Pseudomonadota bacterium]
MSARKLDIYNHVLPRAVTDRMRELAPAKGDIVKRVTSIRMLNDIEARVAMMDQWPGYQQVLTLANPPIEAMAARPTRPVWRGSATTRCARSARPGPTSFRLGWRRCRSTISRRRSRRWTARSRSARAASRSSPTSTASRLDEPEFLPIFERAVAHHRVPIWMHPARSAARRTIRRGEVQIRDLAGAGLALRDQRRDGPAGVLGPARPVSGDGHHHPSSGAMIPYFEGRVGPLFDQLGSRTTDEDYTGLLKRMAKRPVEYFRMFYGDTAVGGSRAAIECGLNFFGPDKVLFATDCPFDPEGGPMFIRDTIAAIDGLALSDVDRRKIYLDNALRLMRLT